MNKGYTFTKKRNGIQYLMFFIFYEFRSTFSCYLHCTVCTKSKYELHSASLRGTNKRSRRTTTASVPCLFCLNLVKQLMDRISCTCTLLSTKGNWSYWRTWVFRIRPDSWWIYLAIVSSSKIFFSQIIRRSIDIISRTGCVPMKIGANLTWQMFYIKIISHPHSCLSCEKC